MKPLDLEEVEEMPTMIHFDESELPEIKKWKVGGKYTLLIDVEQTGMHKDMVFGGNKEMEADFKVLKVSKYTEQKSGNYDPEVVAAAAAKKQ